MLFLLLICLLKKIFISKSLLCRNERNVLFLVVYSFSLTCGNSVTQSRVWSWPGWRSSTQRWKSSTTRLWNLKAKWWTTTRGESWDNISAGFCCLTKPTVISGLILISCVTHRFSGVTAEDLESAAITLRDVQAVLLSMFSAESILIGHSLESDLLALKVSRFFTAESVKQFHFSFFPFSRPPSCAGFLKVLWIS